VAARVTVGIAPATDVDMPFIGATIERLRLDGEDLAPRQFLVARAAGGGVLAFGRIRPYGNGINELGSVAVLEEERGRGVGARIVRELIRRFPTPDVYLTTDSPEYFQRFGFAVIQDYPAAIRGKLERVCSKLRANVVAMHLRKV
jgi:N-acetylglutamate synthase-like GNAT family acetyltransferase